MRSHIDLRSGRFRFLVIAGTALLTALVGDPAAADAATARLRWLPSSSAISGYRVYVRNAGATYGAAVWSGNPTPATDGTISTSVTYTPAPSGVNYFAVVAVGSATGAESALSQELPIGSPNPCRSDSCVAKTSCDFSIRPDGSSCGDDLFCNGTEICQSGTCVSGTRNCADDVACTVDSCDEVNDRCLHTGPPGCCVACDSDDPCLADACAMGDCSAPLGADIEVNRVKMVEHSTGIKLAAKATFAFDSASDPTVSGVEIALLSADGAELYRSIVSADRLRGGATPGRFRFIGPRAQSSVQENGVERLDLRAKGDRWILTIKGEAPTLEGAFFEPTLTLLLRMGDSTCARHLYMECKQTASKSICR